MPTVDVYNQQREKVSEIELAEEVFGAKVQEDLLYAAVRYQMAARRAGTHKAKGRSEVRGGGRKPFKQKGTGRARQGTIRAPQWRGGGVVFGPVPRDHSHKLNKKVRAAAIRSAVSRRVEEGALVVLDNLDMPEIKTKAMVELLNRFEMASVVVVIPEKEEKVNRSARNIQGVTVLPVGGVNVYDILLRDNVLITADAVVALTERLGR
ncbi:MAG: 50S ribosomal protein L4 [Deltaproteobacteria bacterium]|nr:50S ribosomal protein L4 [Deltaproteobacteria bacterium]